MLDTALTNCNNKLLVGQFDGSFIQGKGQHAAGAGIILWEITSTQCPKVLDWIGYELPTAQDSAEAEAAALSLLTIEMNKASKKCTMITSLFKETINPLSTFSLATLNSKV